jgi:hypothetical protein
MGGNWRPAVANPTGLAGAKEFSMLRLIAGLKLATGNHFSTLSVAKWRYSASRRPQSP